MVYPTQCTSIHNINVSSQHENSKLPLHYLHTGPDEIHYQLLKHLPRDSLMMLLDIFNDIWASGEIPECWKEATVIPIPKPGKD